MAEDETRFRASEWELGIAVACVLSLVFFPPAMVVFVPTLIGAVLWRALRADRTESVRRCARCGYALQGLKGKTCPECAAAFLNPDAERERVLRGRADRLRS